MVQVVFRLSEINNEWGKISGNLSDDLVPYLYFTTSGTGAPILFPQPDDGRLHWDGYRRGD